MKIILNENRKYILRFLRGEDVIAELKRFSEERKIGAAFFYGIGAAREVILSRYNLEKKKYEDSELREMLEIATISGNVSTRSGEIVIHAHGVFGDKEKRARAGHVKRCVVSATCELFLEAFSGEIKRVFDDKSGLNLLD